MPFQRLSLTRNTNKAPTRCSPPPPGPPHTHEAQHHAGEAGSEVPGPSPLWPGRLAQHRQDSDTHAAGRLSAARQRADARRQAGRRSQLSSFGRSSGTT